ncbi:hypothetical protein MHU86_15463 [Fragilaria crotonensis]|nr:hypothetical protein MHU86_15463 [Fragilaria crotonensis]
MRVFACNLVVYFIVFISIRNVRSLPTPAPSATPSSGPSISNVPSTSGQPSRSAAPTTAQSPSHEPSISAQPSDSAEPTTAQSLSDEPSMSAQASQSAEPTNIRSPSYEPSISARPSESPEPTSSQSLSPEPSISAQPSESAEPTNSQSPSDEPSISIQPSSPPSGPPSRSPESKCIITLGRVKPICLQTSTSGGFACFVLKDLVPFQTSTECRLPTVTFDSCMESKVVMKSLYPDLFPTIDSQMPTTPASEEAGYSSLDQLLSKVNFDVNVALGRHGNEDGTAHIKSVVGDNIELDDNGGYTERPESLSKYVSSRLAGRRHRRQPMDERPSSGPNQRRQDVTRSLAQRDRDHAMASRTIKKSPGVIREGDKASNENNADMTARRERSRKKGGMMNGNRSMRMMSMSAKKTEKGKSGTAGAPPSPQPAPTALIIPSAAPSLGVNQRAQDFTAVDCDTPCVDFGDVICLRASMLTSLALITSVSYTVSDAGGASQSFEMDVRIASAASCVAALSKCIEKDVPV